MSPQKTKQLKKMKQLLTPGGWKKVQERKYKNDGLLQGSVVIHICIVIKM